MASLVPEHHTGDTAQSRPLARPGVQGQSVSVREDHRGGVSRDTLAVLHDIQGDTIVGDYLVGDSRRRFDPHELTGLQATSGHAFSQRTHGHTGREDAERSEALGAPAQIGHAHPST